jgi:succinate dehydrogenase / fumarate reductase flavoprotein subunit
MATGGCGRLFKITTNSLEAVGDSYAITLRASTELQDMEMIQFNPTGIVYEKNVLGMLVIEAMRGEGGILTNIHGEIFMIQKEWN